MLRHMSLCKGHIRGVTRLIAGLFAVQLVLTGFCLLPSDAHAMPTAKMSVKQTDLMTKPCSKSVRHSVPSGAQHSACFHCNGQNLFVKVAVVDLPTFTPMLSLVLVMARIEAWSESAGHTAELMPTGPPRSSSLLYATTQRILI